MDRQQTSSGSQGEPARILQIVAKSLESKIRHCNIGDANVAWTITERSRVQDGLPANRFTSQLKTELLGRTVRVLASKFFLKVVVLGRFSNAVVSINRIDRLMLTKPTGITIASGRLPVFLTQRGLQRLQCHELTVIESRQAQELVASIVSSAEDSAHVYGNAVVCYLYEPKSSDGVLHVLRDMLSLAESLEVEVETGELESIRLPSQFLDIAPLADRWCISDDTEREEAIEAASVQDLRYLVEKVKPRLADINAFLDEVGMPADESAALGTLAECALEAELYLSRHDI